MPSLEEVKDLNLEETKSTEPEKAFNGECLELENGEECLCSSSL